MSNPISVSDARAKLPTLVNNVGKTLNRITITVKGQPMAALVSFEELESLEETAEVLTIPGIKKSIKEGLQQAKKGQGTPLSKLE